MHVASLVLATQQAKRLARRQIRFARDLPGLCCANQHGEGVMNRSIKGLVLSCGVACAISGMAGAQVSNYQLVGQFALPANVDAFDVGPDGRLWGISGTNIVRQTSVNSGSYETIGSVPTGTVSSFGASFFRMNQDGLIAVGDNNFGAGARVHIVEASQLNSASPTATRSAVVGNFDAAWRGSTLFVSGVGAITTDFVPYVARIDVSDAAIPLTAQRVINATGGASAGVAISGDAFVTGVGFAGGGLVAGDMRVFSASALSIATSSIAYGAGAAVPGGPVLSASPLAFDALGQLLVGGGDPASFGGRGDVGYAAVINIATGDRLQLNPAGGTTARYSVDFNPITTESWVSSGGVVYRYAIPTPGAACIAGCGLVVAMRRARKSRAL
jgi:hypothetical protein